MGCSNSKLDDLPAVQLCRERCSFLDEAIAQRYALAEAHVAYIHSLREIGFSLDRFFDQDLDGGGGDGDLSPFLNLPPHKKGDPVVLVENNDSTVVTPAIPASASAAPIGSSPHHKKSHSHSHSSSGGSHLHFHSDSDDGDDDDEDDDDDDGSLHHPSPSHFQRQQYHHFQDQEPYGDGGRFMKDQEPYGDGGRFMNMNMNMNMNYMRNGSTPSVVYQQRPMSPETVHMRSGGGGGGEGSPSYFQYSNYPNYENPNPNPYPPYYGNSNYPPPPTQSSSYSNYGYFGGYGSMYPPTPSQPQTGPSSSMASSSKPPPPPPSPPRTSPWDFLNLFETVDRYYPPNTPSRDSRSVREEEGIPDLEDENFQDEVVKEVHGDQKYSDGGGNYNNYSKKKKVAEEEEEKGNGGEGTSGKDGMEYEVHSVDKKVVQNEERSEEKNNVPTFKAKVGTRGVSVVIREIKSQFERASESGIEVSTMLEAGKVRFHRKGGVHQVSSKMLHSITPSLSVVSSHPTTSKSAETSSNAGSVYLEIDERVGMRSGNLSLTLQKLYIWEKKLYDEVKAEEKMRIVHERKVRRLKRLDEKGAESQKIDATRTLVRSLSTKIRIAIQVVDKISVKINKLRDEELWPQINELIKGLIRMWKVMLECHQYQCQAIAEAKNLDALTSNQKLSGDHVQATMQLEHELLNWISSFSLWIGAQKGYVKALNGWLVKCLLYEPEETADGIVPFSPSRLGAPPVFVICNQWSQAMDRISEKEVIDAMRIFTMSVHQLSERHSMEFRQRMLTNKDMERKVKELEREEQKMQKEWQTIDKKMAIVSGQGLGLPIPGQIVDQSEAANVSSLHSGLKQIFEAMERFTASSMQAYEELQLRCEEDTHAQENANVP